MMVEFGRTESLLDVLTHYEILGFYRLGLNRLKYRKSNISSLQIYQNWGLPAIVRETSDCIMHKQVFNILQVPKLWMACLKLKYGETTNLLDVLTQYEILEF